LSTVPTLAERQTKGWSAPPIWRGAHFGVHGALDLTDVSFNAPVLVSTDTTSYAVGLHGGYSWQVGALVAGYEIDATLHDMDGSGQNSGYRYATSGSFSATARGRLGLAYENVLFYGTLGGAIGLFETSVIGNGVTMRTDDFAAGLVYGVGAEMQLLPSLSLRIEALQYDYGSVNNGGGGVSYDADNTSVRAGLTLRFN